MIALVWGVVILGAVVATALEIRAGRRRFRSEVIPARIGGRFRVETRGRLEHYIVDDAGRVIEGPIDSERQAEELRDILELARGVRP